MTEGLIVKINSSEYTVKSNDNNYICVLRGIFRNDKITPCVGDRVFFDPKELVINRILARKNILLRPPVSNVDIGIIVTSVKEPNINMTLLDKLISNIIINKITPIICLTKLDLLKKIERNQINEIIKYYRKIGIKVVTNTEIFKLKRLLKDKIVVLCGQTGAGKSSLINKIDKNLKLKTGEISSALGRGKHTTRIVSLYDLKKFYIVDTPGFSQLDFVNCNKNNIRNSFIEFDKYPCKYKNCEHILETDCEVKRNVLNNNIMKSRYESYIRFLKEIK